MFTQWMQTQQKSYHHDEFHVRYQNFKKNADFIDSWNSVPGRHVVKMNQFGDLNGEEFSNFFLGVKPVDALNPIFKPADPTAYPVMFDWRHQGAVTAIKNQQQCGSCWSFSTTGSVEGCHFLGTQKLVSLSEQNLMDCSTAQGNQGCNGGLMTAAMQYIISNGGIDTEASYPYSAEDGTCSYSASNSGATLGSFVNVNSGDEGDLQAKVFQGPVSVAIDASQSSFQFYSSGVYSDPNCSTSQLDHGVLTIGWGKTGGSNAQPYWIVKNSWGTGWGQNGFFWMARNDNNMCGIATMATLPQKCH
jgi:cathepsin L